MLPRVCFLPQQEFLDLVAQRFGAIVERLDGQAGQVPSMPPRSQTGLPQLVGTFALLDRTGAAQSGAAAPESRSIVAMVQIWLAWRLRTTPQMMRLAVAAAEAMPNVSEPMLMMSGTLSAVRMPPPRNGS